MFQKGLKWVETGLNVIGSLAIFMMMILVTTDVSSRYFFNNPITGQKEVTEMLMVLAVYLGMAYTQQMKGHIGMDMLVDKLPSRGRHLLRLITSLLSTGIMGLLGGYTLQQTLRAYEQGTASIFLLWPMWPMPLVVSIGSMLLAVRLLYETVQHAVVIYTGEEKKMYITDPSKKAERIEG